MTPRERWERERQAHALTELKLTTYMPSKYLVVDRETGDQWEWRDGSWKAATNRLASAEELKMAQDYIHALQDEVDALRLDLARKG